MRLSREQTSAAIQCASAAGDGGRFVFVTGKAGSGKSTVLRALRDSGMQMVVCAPTGLAALNVGGQTLHSTFRLETGPNFPEKAKTIESRRLAPISAADAIVIDEISMVRADVIDTIDVALRRSINPDLPFGGKTLIAFGDLWQLEPVAKAEDWKLLKPDYRSPFFFDAQVFRGGRDGLLDKIPAAELELVALNEVHRQSGDPEFTDALNSVRYGDTDHLPYLNQFAGSRPDPTELVPILTFTNDRAESVNAQQLERLLGESQTYEAEIEGTFGRELPCMKTLELRVGARVMAIKNVTDYEAGVRVVNGDVGEVIEFRQGVPIVEFRDGRVWNALPEAWEKVSFSVKGSGKDREVTRVAEASVKQIPLKLAWGITVHKSQGQTLGAVELELETRSRSHGQLYVALSRVRSSSGLYLRRPLRAQDIVVNRRVQEFFGHVPDRFESPVPSLFAQ